MNEEEQLNAIRQRKHDYVVASRHSERDTWLAESEEQEGWIKCKQGCSVDFRTGRVRRLF